jgi:hypothetical protein
MAGFSHRHGVTRCWPVSFRAWTQPERAAIKKSASVERSDRPVPHDPRVAALPGLRHVLPVHPGSDRSATPRCGRLALRSQIPRGIGQATVGQGDDVPAGVRREQTGPTPLSHLTAPPVAAKDLEPNASPCRRLVDVVVLRPVRRSQAHDSSPRRRRRSRRTSSSRLAMDRTYRRGRRAAAAGAGPTAGAATRRTGATDDPTTCTCCSAGSNVAIRIPGTLIVHRL